MGFSAIFQAVKNFEQKKVYDEVKENMLNKKKI